MVYQVYHLSILNAHLGEIIYSDPFNELKAFLKNRRNQRGSRGRQHLLFGCRCGFWAGRRKGWVLTLMVQNFISPKCLYEGYVQFSNTNYCLFSFFKPLNPLISGWYLSALWLVLFLSFSWVKFPPRSHAEPLCRWPAMSAGPRLMLRRLGDMKLIILSWKNWAFPKSIQLGTSYFRRPILGIFFSTHHRKMHQWRPASTSAGHRLCVVPWIRPTLAGWG